MKDGICPKCGSGDIFVQTGKGYRAVLLVDDITETFLTDLVCGKCGYTERYVTEDEALKKIRENWQTLSHHKLKHKHEDDD